MFLRTNLKGAEKKRTLQKHPFGQPFLRTTPLLWRTLILRGRSVLLVEAKFEASETLVFSRVGVYLNVFFLQLGVCQEGGAKME